MSNRRRCVLIHLIGHHDLYLTFVGPSGEQVTALHTSQASKSVGQLVIDAMSASAPGTCRVEDDAVLFACDPSVASALTKEAKWKKRFDIRPRELAAEGLATLRLCGARAPLLGAAVQAFRQRLDPDTEASVVLVTTGPRSETFGASGDEDAQREIGHSTELLGHALGKMLRETALGDGLIVEPPAHLDTGNAHDMVGVPELVERVRERLAEARRAIVAQNPSRWSEDFGVYLSLNTGPVPVIVGLTRGLGEFKHDLVHIPAARKWPSKGKPPTPTLKHAVILDASAIRQRPPRPVTTLTAGSPEHLAAREMVAWRGEFVGARPTRAADLERDEQRFWFRKGKQEVLAVVVVSHPDTGALVPFRGVNLEVSLPTGTLCAERNAIGSAVAAIPKLERRHIQAVAVLSLKAGRPELGPCGACQEWLQKMAEVNPDLRVVTFTDEGLTSVCVEAAKAFGF